jgi:hypothetical protein
MMVLNRPEDHGGGLLGGLLGSYASGSESDSEAEEAAAAAGVQQQQRVAPTKDAWASDSDEEAGGVRSVLDTLYRLVASALMMVESTR